MTPEPPTHFAVERENRAHWVAMRPDYDGPTNPDDELCDGCREPVCKCVEDS